MSARASGHPEWVLFQKLLHQDVGVDLWARGATAMLHALGAVDKEDFDTTPKTWACKPSTRKRNKHATCYTTRDRKPALTADIPSLPEVKYRLHPT